MAGNMPTSEGELGGWKAYTKWSLKWIPSSEFLPVK